MIFTFACKGTDKYTDLLLSNLQYLPNNMSFQGNRMEKLDGNFSVVQYLQL